MATFELFRYQLLPASQEPQQDLFGESLTLERIKEQKNVLFWEVLQQLFPFDSPDLLQKVLLAEGGWLVVKLAPRRKAAIHKPNFRSEFVEDWPYVTLFINNDPEVQVVGVSRNQRAFKDPFSVVRKLERRITRHLTQRGLTVHFQSMYDQMEFWGLMREQRGNVQKVRFEMIAPNMANISGVLKLDLRRLNQEAKPRRPRSSWRQRRAPPCRLTSRTPSSPAALRTRPMEAATSR